MLAPYTTRADGWIWSHIEMYRSARTLSSTVKDAGGNPLDGVHVKVRDLGSTVTKKVHIFTITGSDGKYSLKVESDRGSGCSVDISKGYTGTLPQLKAQPASMPPTPNDTYKVVYELEVPREIVSRGQPTRIYEPGNMDFFICDAANYGAYTAGGTFNAFEITKNTSTGSGAFVLPADGKWYVVISNEDKARATEALSITVSLYKKR
jgi:hypothetical protein